MDTRSDDSNHDRLIEDYLFSGYRPASYEPAPDVDQQFARPIEDEDIFEADPDANQAPNQSQSPPKSKSLQSRQRLKEMILAKGIKARKLGEGCDENGMIEVDLDLKPDETPTKGRMIYDRLVKKSDDCKNGLYGGQKLTWPVYKDALRKKICAEKRKVWDSFQKPADNFDDEEEMIMSEGEPVESNPESPPESDPDNSAEPPCESEPGTPTSSLLGDEDMEKELGDELQISTGEQEARPIIEEEEEED